jgi:hypothetical protein
MNQMNQIQVSGIDPLHTRLNVFILVSDWKFRPRLRSDRGNEYYRLAIMEDSSARRYIFMSASRKYEGFGWIIASSIPKRFRVSGAQKSRIGQRAAAAFLTFRTMSAFRNLYSRLFDNSDRICDRTELLTRAYGKF